MNSRKTAPGKPFPKGISGNPNGRPKRTQEEFDLIEACRRKTPEALAVWEHVMINGESEKNRLTAAQMIIERAYGKPKQEVEAQVNGQIEQIVRRIVDPKAE
ncbi:hypothetical protein PBR31_00018 [Xanthomonas phage PBR31]|uniref:DUF5681 domain-containing protein n=1 Tax=Xanthomonas phage PPDBI TaxID=2723911 RepID=A0A6H0X5N7_9CAUD|nr:hypothetical protein PBR31_00018 [Xanthomonas phage PBR31]QIW89377.1 hypothetical protein PPDBI_00018 [Xanthomonas phage PPDBI]